MFLDRATFSARLLAADIFDEGETFWKSSRASFDLVHASSFFHLFGLSKQRDVACALAKLVKPRAGSLVLGLQLAAMDEACVVPIVSEVEPTYCHSPETLEDLWLQAGRQAGFEENGLSWRVSVKDRMVPEAMKIGLLANPKIKEIIWTAVVVQAK